MFNMKKSSLSLFLSLFVALSFQSLPLSFSSLSLLSLSFFLTLGLSLSLFLSLDYFVSDSTLFLCLSLLFSLSTSPFLSVPVFASLCLSHAHSHNIKFPLSLVSAIDFKVQFCVDLKSTNIIWCTLPIKEFQVYQQETSFSKKLSMNHFPTFYFEVSWEKNYLNELGKYFFIPSHRWIFWLSDPKTSFNFSLLLEWHTDRLKCTKKFIMWAIWASIPCKTRWSVPCIVIKHSTIS